MPLRRWQRFVDDIGRFFRQIDFALSPRRLKRAGDRSNLSAAIMTGALARIDGMGLLWQLNGDKLVALSENTAMIETQTGARRRHSSQARGARSTFGLGAGRVNLDGCGSDLTAGDARHHRAGSRRMAGLAPRSRSCPAERTAGRRLPPVGLTITPSNSVGAIIDRMRRSMSGGDAQLNP